MEISKLSHWKSSIKIRIILCWVNILYSAWLILTKVSEYKMQSVVQHSLEYCRLLWSKSYHILDLLISLFWKIRNIIRIMQKKSKQNQLKIAKNLLLWDIRCLGYEGLGRVYSQKKRKEFKKKLCQIATCCTIWLLKRDRHRVSDYTIVVLTRTIRLVNSNRKFNYFVVVLSWLLWIFPTNCSDFLWC